MSAGLAPPRRTRPGATEPEVLFAEARRRRRRRIRLTGIVVSLVLAISAAALAVTFSHRAAVPKGARPGSAQSAGAWPGGARSPLVAWFDDNSRLHVGDLATRTQRVVAAADAYPSTPLA